RETSRSTTRTTPLQSSWTRRSDPTDGWDSPGLPTRSRPCVGRGSTHGRGRRRTVFMQGDTAFVQVVEVWSPEGDRLRFRSGAYGPHTAFAELSRETSFARGEGLPGVVW